LIALIVSTLQEKEICARIKVILQIEPELSRFEVAVLPRTPIVVIAAI